MTPEQLFADRLARDPSRPFVTYYDEASGERTELSVKSLANWVAKTHHLLATELGLGVGDRARVNLPPHWISVPIVLGVLSAGLQFSTGPAAVAFETETEAQVAGGVVDADEGYVMSPEHAAAGVAQPPAGFSDYVAAVRPQADAWGSVQRPAGDDDAFTAHYSRAAAVEAAAEFARARGWPPGARVLSTRDWSNPQDWIDTLLAPLTVGGSLVYVRHTADPGVLARRVAQERCVDQL